MLTMSEKKPRRPFRSTRRANGWALRRYREDADLTLHGLAELSGISYTQISRIETGHTPNPRSSTLKALAAALGVDSRDLVTQEPSPVPDEPGLTDENREKLDAKRREWDAQDEAKRKEGDPNGAGGGTEL